MVTAEPLMDFDKEEFVELIRQCKPRQVNIGRESTRNVTLPEPTPEKVRDLVATLSDFMKVKIKKNVIYGSSSFERVEAARQADF